MFHSSYRFLVIVVEIVVVVAVVAFSAISMAVVSVASSTMMFITRVHTSGEGEIMDASRSNRVTQMNASREYGIVGAAGSIRVTRMHAPRKDRVMNTARKNGVTSRTAMIHFHFYISASGSCYTVCIYAYLEEPKPHWQRSW